MKNTEGLQIGNYVFGVSDRVEIICSILENGLTTKTPNFNDHHTDKIEYYKPISLDEEWLDKFGFLSSGVGYELKTEKFEMSFLYYDGYHFNFNNKYSEYSTVTFYDVHEFQNLYYALTSERLTIKKQ